MNINNSLQTTTWFPTTDTRVGVPAPFSAARTCADKRLADRRRGSGMELAYSSSPLSVPSWIGISPIPRAHILAGRTTLHLPELAVSSSVWPVASAPLITPSSYLVSIISKKPELLLASRKTAPRLQGSQR